MKRQVFTLPFTVLLAALGACSTSQPVSTQPAPAITHTPITSSTVTFPPRTLPPRSVLFVGPRQAGSAIDADITDVAIADVNNDGNLDLIGVYMSSPEIAISYNDGIGNFSLPWYVNEYAGTADLIPSVAPADIDGDGAIDLISATWNGFFGVNGDENSIAINRNQGDGTFAPATLVPVAHPTTDVVADDFNRDGKMDIAATYKDTDAVVVLLNSGQGQFNDYRDYTTGQNLWSLSVAEVNGDGYSDLIAVALSGEITLLINKSDGSFSTTKLTLSAGLQDIATGDLDQDGHQDLVALNSTDNTLTILHNRGNGNFDTGQVITSTHWLNSVTVADFNSDDRLDLAVANYDDVTVSVFSGDGKGNFLPAGEFIIGQAPHDILAADMNGDGHPDIVAGADGVWASVLLNQGDGTFETIDPPYTISSHPQAMETTDLNGDGYLDLVIYHDTNESYPMLTSLLNDGHGHFSIRQEIKGYSPLAGGGYSPEHPLVISDFDGDGGNDVVFASAYYTLSEFGGQLCTLLNDGQGELQSPGAVGNCVRIPDPEGGYVHVNVLRTADLNHDGDMDIVAATSKGINAFFNNGQGQFEKSQIILSQRSGILAVADFNGDGYSDIVVSDPETFNKQLLVILNQGDGTFSSPVAFNAVWGSSYSGLATGDVDNDHDLDLVLIYGGSGLVPTKGQIFLNNGSGQFTAGLELSFPGQSPNDVALADIDLDGNLDVLATTNWNRTVTVNFNDGTGRFDRSEPLLISTIARPNSLAVGDFDLDGDIDIATVGQELKTDYGGLTIRVNALHEPPRQL